MRPNPRTLSHDATIADVRRLFESSRVRLVLLTRHGTCTGMLARNDIPPAAPDTDAAGWMARAPETIHVRSSLGDAHRLVVSQPEGRLVVVDDDGKLCGLLCLNHAGTGFCNDASPCRGGDGAGLVRTRWRIRRTSGPLEHRDGLLVAPEGKRFALGDTLSLPPPGDDARWLVVDVAAEPGSVATGIVTVERLG